MKTITITINIPAEIIDNGTPEQHRTIYAKCMLRMLQLKANTDKVPPEFGLLMSLGGIAYCEVVRLVEEREKTNFGIDNPTSVAE